MPSINDVAEKAGVSTATVSRTFRTPDLINETTRLRVLEAARHLNYQPRRAVVRSLPSVTESNHLRTSNSIGFQFFAADATDTLQSNMFYAPMLAGAQAEADSLGFYLLLHTTDRHSLSLELPRMIVERAVGGMLLVGTTDPAVLNLFVKHVPNIVLLDNRDANDSYESVLSDGFGGVTAAVRYLHDLGHRRIGFFLDESGVATFQHRLSGYYSARLSAGFAPDPGLVVASNSVAESKRRLAGLLCSSQRPTALIAANDESAFDVIDICREIGLRIPEDISLIGFDDVSFSAHTHPPLTTIRVDKEYMGRLAVRRLHARMQAGDDPAPADPPICNLIPVSLVIRESCRSL